MLTLRHDSRQIPIASDAQPLHTSRGFLLWRFAYAGPGVRRATIMGPASANLHNKRHGGRVHFSFDDLVGATNERGWDSEPERLGGLQVDRKLDLRDLLHRQIGRLLAL